MSVETLAVQSLDANWSLVGAATRTLAVAAADATNYLTDPSGSAATDFSVTDSALVGTETISNVTVTMKSKTFANAGDTLLIAASTDNFGPATTSATPTQTNTLADYTLSMNVAPDGGGWTVAKINALKLRCGSQFYEGNQAYVDFLSVAVTYTSPAQQLPAQSELMLLGVG